MARMLQGILGGLSGKIGSVVGSSWKGIPVLKTLPLSVANPRSAGQVAQRNKFTNCVAFAGDILATVIKPLWDRFASKMSGYNEFIQTNVDIFEAATPTPAADLIISKGKMASTAIVDATVTSANSNLVITWADDSGTGFKLSTDEVYIVGVNEDSGDVVGDAPIATRADETATIEMSEAPTIGDTVNVYLAFRRADGTVVSNTGFKATEAYE